MKRVVVEITDDLYSFLANHFHTKDLCKIVRTMIEERAVEMGLALRGFGSELKIKED